VTDARPGAVARAWRRLRRAGYRSAPYRMALARGGPDALRPTPAWLWPGDAARADQMFQGRWRFAGVEIEAPNAPPWRLLPENPRWTAQVNGFGWLEHFAAQGGEAARGHARRLVRSWIDLCGRWDEVLWEPGVLAERLLAWLGHSTFLLEGADPAFRRPFLDSLAQQHRHLMRSADMAPPGRPSLRAATALVAGGLALPGAEAATARGAALLERALAAQVLADGGHVGRAPSVQLAVLRDLIHARACWREAARDPPLALQHAIDRMAPLARALRHGDGGLAVFNGGFELDAAGVEVTLARSEVAARPLLNAPHAGYQRIAAGRLVLLADGGAPAPAGLEPPPHAGALAIELSVGRHRLIVGCGGGAEASPEWLEAARQTAAHSTLVLDDRDSSELMPAGGLGARRVRHAEAARREDEAGNVWLELAHDGWRPVFGVDHRRRLYLSAAGEDVRGHDVLEGEGLERAAGRPFQLRFHLHPQVQATGVQEGGAILLKLPGGQGWRFRAAGGALTLEESVYLGQAGEIRRSRQIVVSGNVRDDGDCARWALKKV